MLEGVSHHSVWKLSTELQVTSGGQRRYGWATISFHHVFFLPSRKTLRTGRWSCIPSCPFPPPPVLPVFPFQTHPLEPLLPVSFPGNRVGMGAQRQLLPFSRWPKKEFSIMKCQLIEKYLGGETEIYPEPWNKLPSRLLPDVSSLPALGTLMHIITLFSARLKTRRHSSVDIWNCHNCKVTATLQWRHCVCELRIWIQ